MSTFWVSELAQYKLSPSVIRPQASSGAKWTFNVIVVTLFMAFIRATVSMYYYGLSFNTNAFGGSKYENLAFRGRGCR